MGGEREDRKGRVGEGGRGEGEREVREREEGWGRRRTR